MSSERAHKTVKQKSENPIQITLPAENVNEEALIKVLRSTNLEVPIEIIIEIGTYKEFNVDFDLYGTAQKNRVEDLTLRTSAILSAFDKAYGTCHEIIKDIQTEPPREESCYDIYKGYAHTLTTHNETGYIQAVLLVTVEKRKEILQKAINK